MIYPIRYYGDPVLRKQARPVTVFNEELKTLADDMLETMYDANGVGLAAPQIGLSKRLFVALQLEPVEDEVEDDAEAELSTEEKRKRWGVKAEHVMINPKITARSGEQVAQDGCLSVPGLFVEEMRRDQAVTVRYQDVEGNTHALEAEGHFAHVIQHEFDHLNGVLFFDRLPETERKRFMNEHRRELAELQREAKAWLKHGDHPPLAKVQ